ncbi:MAG: hypothetical protein EHM64_12720, partial [Ignavibacteriae bacterium]
VSISFATGYDIGFSSIAATPEDLTRKDPVSLKTCIKNFGSLPASAYSVRFFYDGNRNGHSDPAEQFSEYQGNVLAPRDSITCTALHAPVTAGENSFAALIEFPPDENRTNDSAWINVMVGSITSDILINEIMYCPAGDEPEWVELFNTTSDTIDIKKWRISDSNTSIKSWITRERKAVPPRSFMVVAKDASFAEFHPGVPFVAADFSAFNNFTPDAVVIYDNHGNAIDSVMYTPSWGGQNGKSLERVDQEWSSQQSINWGSSRDSAGSTPGFINSIARLDYDIEIGHPCQRDIIVNGKAVPVVLFSVYNIGRHGVDTILLRFYTDINNNAQPEQSEFLQTLRSDRPLPAGDSMEFSESLPQLVSGENTVIILADWPRDTNIKNNRATVSVKRGFEPRRIVINEIMYDPLPGQTEWFELLNRSDDSIDLANWIFHDKPGSTSMNSFELSSQPFVIESGGYAVIAADSTLFQMYPDLAGSESRDRIRILNRSTGLSFNNDGDDLILKDLTGQVIDSIAYIPAWHHPGVEDTRGRSLERINRDMDSNDPRNWSTCVNMAGGTPGGINSVRTTGTNSSSMISLSPNPFSPDGDGFEDFCIIRYNLSSLAATLNIKIYDIKGRLVRLLANGEQTGPQGEMIWDGYDDNRQRARIGVYVIFLEATDRTNSSVATAKAVSVVAVKL